MGRAVRMNTPPLPHGAVLSCRPIRRSRCVGHGHSRAVDHDRSDSERPAGSSTREERNFDMSVVTMLATLILVAFVTSLLTIYLG